MTDCFRIQWNWESWEYCIILRILHSTIRFNYLVRKALFAFQRLGANLYLDNTNVLRNKTFSFESLYRFARFWKKKRWYFQNCEKQHGQIRATFKSSFTTVPRKLTVDDLALPLLMLTVHFVKSQKETIACHYFSN